MSAVSATLVCECLLLAACSANEDVPSPRLSSIEPDHAAAGAVVTLHGDHFCQRPRDEPDEGSDAPCDVSGQVYFGTAPGTPVLWTDVAIAVEVPAGVFGSVRVRVIAAGRQSDSVAFTAE